MEKEEEPGERREEEVSAPPQEDATERPDKQAGWVGVLGHLDSPSPRHHQLHFHFVGNDDPQNLTIGTFPQPAWKQGSWSVWILGGWNVVGSGV